MYLFVHRTRYDDTIRARLVKHSVDKVIKGAIRIAQSFLKSAIGLGSYSDVRCHQKG